MRIITCKNLTMRYDTKPAVSEVSFDVAQHDYLCIVGENGSGKTTLMKGLLGLMKPSGGQITLHGLKRTEIGYMPQQTASQKDFPASVYEVVLSGCLNSHGLFPFYSKKDTDKADWYLAYLGITALKKKSFRDLSGGQQQRALLARALCATDKLLLLDEPVTGLDPAGTVEMYTILRKLNQETGITIIMISHDIQNAVQYANKILHMQTSLVFFGTTEDYRKSPAGGKMLGEVQDA